MDNDIIITDDIYEAFKTLSESEGDVKSLVEQLKIDPQELISFISNTMEITPEVRSFLSELSDINRPVRKYKNSPYREFYMENRGKIIPCKIVRYLATSPKPGVLVKERVRKIRSYGSISRRNQSLKAHKYRRNSTGYVLLAVQGNKIMLTGRCSIKDVVLRSGLTPKIGSIVNLELYHYSPYRSGRLYFKRTNSLKASPDKVRHFIKRKNK